MRARTSWHLGAMVLAAVLLVGLPPAGPSPVPPYLPWGPAQAMGQSPIAEMRAIAPLREAQQGGTPQAQVEAARGYLEQFPKGRYADEAQLTLAQALRQAGQEEAALEAYEALIRDHPDSPFKDQALSESLPLLMTLKGNDEAISRADNLLKDKPESVHRDQVLIWQAGLLYEERRFKEALEKLEKVHDPDSLRPEEQARAYRMHTLSLLRTGQSAWKPLKKYLASNAPKDQKAAVLLDVAEVARKSGRHEEALGYYKAIVEDYPGPAYLGDALYWRAETHYQHKMAKADQDDQAEEAPAAMALFNAYLESEDSAHRGAAMMRRGELKSKLGDLSGAATDYEEAARADERIARDTDTLLKRARIYKELKQPAAAAALLKTARTDPALSAKDKTTLQLEEARLNYEVENCPQVEKLLHPMPFTDNEELRTRALFMRGFCRYREGRHELASFDLEGVMRNPDYAKLALEPLLGAYEQSGQHTRFIYLVENHYGPGSSAPDGPMLERISAAFEKLGEPAMMVAFFQDLQAQHPKALNTPQLHLKLGEALDALGKQDEAAVQYGKALELIQASDPLPPEYVDTVRQLHQRYLALGRVEDLQRLHESATAALTGTENEALLRPMRRDALLAQARAALQSNDGDAVKKAEGFLEQAAKLTPKDDAAGQAHLAAAQVALHLRAGAPGPALELYRKQYAKLPSAPPLRADPEAPSDPATPGEASALSAVPGQGEFTDAILTTLAPHADGLGKGKTRDAMERLYLHQLAGLKGAHRARERNLTAQRLEALYREEADHAGRAILTNILRKSEGLEDSTRAELLTHQGRVYLEWGRALQEAGKDEEAAFQIKRATPLLKDADWRTRYSATALHSQLLMARKEYGAVIQQNEAMLEAIPDDALKADLRRFIGQVYLDWARQAHDEKNLKSARIRYHRAMDMLAPESGNPRLAAAGGLFQVLTALKKGKQGLAVLENAVRAAPAGEGRTQYALYLGKVMADQFKNTKGAMEWLKEADDGGNGPVALEAGYLLAGHLESAKRTSDARVLLAELAKRGLENSQWRVPINYRLAVSFHRVKNLDLALKHYRMVAGEQDPGLKKLYSRTISQSGQQARDIAKYLKATKGGGNIAIPKVKE